MKSVWKFGINYKYLKAIVTTYSQDNGSGFQQRINNNKKDQNNGLQKQ